MDFTSRTTRSLKCIIVFCLIIESNAIEVRCGKPGRAPTGQFEPKADSYFINSVVTYYCEPPFLVAKPYQRICQSDGTWSGGIPLCYNKSIVYQFICSSSLQGKTPAKAADNDPETCFSTGWETDGHWSAILPYPSIVAVVKIDFPSGQPINVEVSVKNEDSRLSCSVSGTNRNGNLTSVTFHCPGNTRGLILDVRDLSSEYHFFEICEAEIFTIPEDTCLFPDVPANSFGNMLISGLYREYTYFCNEGYDLFGAQKSTCHSPGTWTPKAPACFATHCSSENTSVANGAVVVNSTAVHSISFLICNEGYKPLTDDRIQCLPTGQWSQASLICSPILCDREPKVPHGSVRLLANSTFYGSRLQVKCDPGYIAKDNGLRMCEKDGKWEDLSDACIERTCNSLPEEIQERGVWDLFNKSTSASQRAIRVLKCHPGYHIVGAPPIIQCLENGSWSFSVATCMKTPQVAMSTEEWSPNAMLTAAVAAGAGTAVCILCLVGSFFGIRKRRHLRTTTAVFHVGMANPPTFISTVKGLPMSPEEHLYTTAIYEDIPDSQCYEITKPRNRPGNQSYEPPKLRKPSVGLPLLCLDTDPVYAQPYETGSSASLAETKLRRGCVGSKDDPYSGHIYAEPVDSRRPPSGSSTVSGCIAETWFRGGTTMKMGRKMSLPDCQQIPKSGSSSVLKINEARRTSSTAFLCPEGTEKEHSRESTGQRSSNSSRSLGVFSELQNNSIYLSADDQDLQPRPLTSGYKITDNDIYRHDCFSSA